MTITFQAPYDLIQATIQLPSANLGDYIAPQAKTIIRNSMDGTLYSTVKTNNRIKFDWDISLTNAKARELDQFIAAYNSYYWRVYDWNENMYRAVLLTNPIQFTPVSKNSVNVRLEFEGALIV